MESVKEHGRRTRVHPGGGGESLWVRKKRAHAEKDVKGK